ncbi:MAG TPA: ferredoxin--NADP reductase [Flavobacteriia bacterium]|nr:ferredoxin--NADP reductase [Flavobacteriia bacterium]
MASFYKVTVKNIIKETDKAVSIAFAIPAEIKDKFQYIAGQYITIKTKINGEEIRRAYSICTAPNSGEIRIVVKEIENGTFSVYANRNLKDGAILEISEPEGKFILPTNPNNAKNYLGFAAGSGITPIMAMIQAVITEEPKSKFVLVYGNKTVKDTIFYNKLNALQQNYPNQFKVQYVFSKEQPEGSLFGRIDASIVNFVLNKNKETVFNDAYLCGPEQMIHTVKGTLQSKGFTEDQIHFELFTPTENIGDNFDNISLTGKAKITVLLDEEETSFEMDKKETILEAALKHHLDAPYSCQGGICSSCIAKLTEGKAIMDKNTILSKEEVAQGLVLTCQAHPVTDVIVVDYDDV